MFWTDLTSKLSEITNFLATLLASAVIMEEPCWELRRKNHKKEWFTTLLKVIFIQNLNPNPNHNYSGNNRKRMSDKAILILLESRIVQQGIRVRTQIFRERQHEENSASYY